LAKELGWWLMSAREEAGRFLGIDFWTFEEEEGGVPGLTFHFLQMSKRSSGRWWLPQSAKEFRA
jgi:hypothetical protein